MIYLCLNFSKYPYSDQNRMWLISILQSQGLNGSSKGKTTHYFLRWIFKISNRFLYPEIRTPCYSPHRQIPLLLVPHFPILLCPTVVAAPANIKYSHRESLLLFQNRKEEKFCCDFVVVPQLMYHQGNMISTHFPSCMTH